MFETLSVIFWKYIYTTWLEIVSIRQIVGTPMGTNCVSHSDNEQAAIEAFNSTHDTFI